MNNGQIEFRQRSEYAVVGSHYGMQTHGYKRTVEFRQWFDGGWTEWAAVFVEMGPTTQSAKIDA